tara:strand:+ start:184 stop:792 length:609 start_codon:yes stop_codon:yes gene_type:complete
MQEFLAVKEKYDAETELVKQLKKKPLTEGQVIDMITRGYSQLEVAQRMEKFRPLISDLRTRGLIIDDTPLSFKEFKEANVGVICMKQSTFAQMTITEYERFKSALRPASSDMLFSRAEVKPWKLYEDLPLSIEGQYSSDYINHYRMNNGKISGSGWNVETSLLVSNPLSFDDEKKFNEASKLYKNARSEIKAIFNELEIQTD